MALFDGFRSMSPRLQQQGYKSPWTYLRDIAQQSPQQFSGYPPGYGLPPTPIPGYSPDYVTGGVKPPYPVTASRPEGPRYSSEQLAEIQRLQNTPGATAPKIGILSYPGMASASAPSFTPPGGGAFPADRLNNPLSPDKYNLAPGQSGAAYDIGGGRTLYTGGAQSPTSFARGNARRLKSQLDQMRGRLNVQYDPSQFSENLNYYLNNRVLGYNNWTPERQNEYLGRLGGWRELESARRAASPEYAQLSQQYAAAPRGIIR